MKNIVDPTFQKELKNLGLKEWNHCYNCGNCTAICPHAKDEYLFPRKNIRIIQLGLKDKLKSKADPWLCYYCGDCSETCPQKANPGELMMTVRRYLTTVYDWTGLSRLFYKSSWTFVLALFIVAFSTLFMLYRLDFHLSAMMEFGHKFEKLAILFVAGVILVPNMVRMNRFLTGKQLSWAPILSIIKAFGTTLVHFATQKDALKCEKNKLRWFEHLMVMFGYLLLLFTTVFLNWLSTENQIVIRLGYLVGIITFVVTFDFIVRRVRQEDEVSRFSHPTDWFFVIWLFLMGFSAFLVRLFIDLEIISLFSWLYPVHLMILAQWAVIIVPFGKWTHFLYRLVSIYTVEQKREVSAEHKLVTIS